jgi:hypothetical protein
MAKSPYNLENNEAENEEGTDSQFAINDLKEAESLSRGSNGQSSTSPGKVKFNSSDDGRSYSPGLSSTSTVPSEKVDYDTSDKVPDAEKSLYNSSPTQPGRLKFRNLLGTRRRKILLGGGVVSSGIALLIFLIGSGPLEFVHLSQVLQRNFFGTSNTIQIRNKGLLRFARTGNVEETRLGMLGSKVYNRTLSQMKEQGMEFTDKNTRGVPRKLKIDTSKNDNFKDIAEADRKAAVADFFSVENPGIISQTGSTTFEINLDNTTMKGIDFTKATAKTAIGSLNSGKIETGLATRYVKSAWDLPGLFSPLSKLKAAALNKFVSGASSKQAADEADAERLAAEEKTVTTTPEVVAAESDVKGALDTLKSNLNRILIAQAGLCAVRGAANSAVVLNRAFIVLPATIQASDKMAVGSQVQTGQNFDDRQLGAVKDSFENEKGQTIWSARALKATAGNATPSGPDLPVDYAQAFSGNTTADQIRDAIKFDVLGHDVTGLACSKVGLAAGVLAGIIAVVASIPTDGATGVGYAAWAAEQAASAIAVGGLIYMFETHLTDLLQDKAIVPAVLSGPLGGNLMAYGARELSNTAARSMGGVALDNSNKTVLTYDEEREYDQEFQQQGTAKRLFDVYDERSAVSKLIDSVSPSVQENASNIASFFTNFGSMFSHTFTPLVPHAAAASGYDWGFPKYGFSESLAEDKNYEDPYSNADAVAKMLDQQHCDTDTGCHLRKDAMGCFGVDINKDSGQWEVVAQKDVNPSSDDYPDDCSDGGDSWNRVRLFILDSRIMDTIACHQGTDEQSCVNISESSSAAPVSQVSGGSGSLPSGDSKTLAQQLLPFISQGKLFCGSAAGGSGPSNCADIQNTAKGQLLGGNCQVNALTPHLLGLILVLVRDKGWTLGISAMCSDHHLEGDGPYAGHSYGSAADFSVQNGASGAAAAADEKFVDDAASILASSGGSFGQINCHPTYAVLSNSIFTTFSDDCSHQHIRAAP